MILSRREALAGAALLALPAAASGEDARLTHALDSLTRDMPAAAKLAALHRFDAARLGPSARLDLLTLRNGLAVDLAIERRFADVKAIADVPVLERPTYYELLLRRRVGAVGVAQARARLDAKLAALRVKADATLRRRGYGGGVLWFYAMMIEPKRLLPDSDAGRDQAVAMMNAMLAERRAFVGKAFGPVPRWCLDVAVSRPARPGEPAGRRIIPQPNMPGGYIVDLKDIARRPAWTLGSVVSHELLPGHLLQLGIETAAGMSPLRADYAAGFVEGWATYAEELVATSGWPASDPDGEIGCLHWLLFRAARARMDIGLHVDGWSLDQARAFLEAHQGPPVYFAPYDVELKRAAAEPASRAADAIAWLAIADRAPRDPRRRRAFHARMLAGGRKRIEHLGSPS